MARTSPKPAPFLEHDRVEKRVGTVVEHGVVVMVQNRATRETFPIVWIQDGPRKNQREYVSKGWRALLDLDGPAPHLPEYCIDCARPFRGPIGSLFCRTCTQFQRPASEAQ